MFSLLYKKIQPIRNYSTSLEETSMDWVTIPACGQKKIYFSFSQQILCE